MRKEAKIFLGIGSLLAISKLSTFAFSPPTRREMFKRDKGQCVDCGKRFSDGWLLDCSHYDHDHSSEDYDSVDNGRVQCLDDHLQYHVEIGDQNGQYLIKKRIRETQGGHTREWIERQARGK